MTDDELRVEIAKRLGYRSILLGEGRVWFDAHGPIAVLPNWPRNIADAWGLVEKLPRTVRVEVSRFGREDWLCSITRYFASADELIHVARAPTAARAISEAWLLANPEAK